VSQVAANENDWRPLKKKKKHQNSEKKKKKKKKKTQLSNKRLIAKTNLAALQTEYRARSERPKTNQHSCEQAERERVNEHRSDRNCSLK
jgi:hypothetical protein